MTLTDDANCVGGLWHQAYWIENLRNRPEWPNSLMLNGGNAIQVCGVLDVLTCELRERILLL